MKIISKFKDYYDFVGHSLYAGGDDKVVYLRGEIKTKKIKYEFPIRELKNLRSIRTKTHIINIKWLVVCGKGYMLISYHKPHPISPKDTPYRIITEEEFEKHFEQLYYRAGYHHFVGIENVTDIEISKKINQPIFIIDSITSIFTGKARGWYPEINPEVPSLEKLGFPRLQDPYTLFQDIEHFISNVLRENPDTKPPVEVSNESKIIAGGFDLKQSFRHREK